MSVDDIIRTQMTAAGMLMEDLSARVVIEPLAPGHTEALRDLAESLVAIADIVDAIRSL